MNFIPSKAAKGAAALSLAVVMALPALAGCSMLKAKSEAPAGQEQQVQTQENTKTENKQTDSKTDKAAKSTEKKNEAEKDSKKSEASK